MDIQRKKCVAGLGIALMGLCLGLNGCSEQMKRAVSKDPKATVLIQVSMAPGDVMPNGNNGNLAEEFRIFKATQIQKIKSPFVLAAALRDPEIISLNMVQQQTDPIAWLQNRLELSYPGDAEMMTVSLSGDDSQQCAKVVNAVVNAYLKEAVENEQRIKKCTMANLEEALATNEQKIRRKRTQLKRLLDELGTGSRDETDLQLRTALEELSQSRTQLVSARRDLRKFTIEHKVLQARLARLEKQGDSEPKPEGPNQSRIELQRKAEELSAVAKQLEQVVGSLADVEVSQRLRNELTNMQQQLEAWQKWFGPELVDYQRAELKDKIQESEIKIQLTSEDIANFERDVQREKEEFGKFGRTSIDLEMAQADIENLDKVTREIAKKLEMLRIESQSRPRIQIWQEAAASR